MPKTIGWERPDIKSMSREELLAHLAQMREIGEGYIKLYETGQFPPSPESWADWWARTTPEFVVFYGHMPEKGDILVSQMMAKTAANPPDMSMIKEAWQDDVNIHPFPGGCLFEQTLRFVKTDGTEVRLPGLHIFYANAEGKIVRSHEYYDFSIATKAGLPIGF